jgi:hypothetical protein
MPLEAFAQTVITVAPEIVGGVGCSTSTPITFRTQSISALAGVEGSIRGLTGDSNLALSLGIGYESRGFDGNGYPFDPQGYGPDLNVIRENYVDLNASIRYAWFQVGTVIGFPLNWHLTLDITLPTPYEWSLNNADMTTTVGVFAAGNFTVSEWTSGKLNFIARLDLDGIFGELKSGGVRLTNIDSPPTLLYFPDTSPVLLARIGLSYEFSVWSGK